MKDEKRYKDINLRFIKQKNIFVKDIAKEQAEKWEENFDKEISHLKKAQPGQEGANAKKRSKKPIKVSLQSKRTIST